MKQFFSINTYTPWDGLNTNLLASVKMLSLKSVFKTFPVIEPEFFDDLLSNVYKNNHYSFTSSIKRIVGPDKEDYDIISWNFVWAMDNERRMYQFLFQKVEEEEKSFGVLVALAPPELAKLFSDFKKEAILRILSLLNNPSQIKFLMILAPKGKSLAEEQQLFQINKKDIEKVKFVNDLKNIPNIRGDWFLSHQPKCPICNGLLRELEDYNIGFGKLICSQCGYKKIK